MTFVLSQKESFTWPVTYRMPKDGGKYDKQEFTVEFKRLPESRIREIKEQADRSEIEDDALIAEILLGWSGIRTAEGEEFPYNETNKRVLFDLFPGVRAAIILTWFAALGGAVRKN